MATIGFIGSGSIGGTVARLAAAAGYQVALSNSRGPHTLQDLVSEIGPLASAGTAEQAAQADDIVVVSIPLVKVFNNIYYRHLQALARPAGAPDRSALPIAGDDTAAKQAVTVFLDAIGYDAVDTGMLAGSWCQEPGSPAYGGVYGDFANETGTPADADALRAKIPGTRP